MKQSDVGRPEPVLFLLEAADAMVDYHEKHGTYPREWYLLDMTFANGPFLVTDPDIRAKKEDGSTWRPRDCEYRYQIARADDKEFLVQALSQQGVAEYEMRRGMEVPCKLIEHQEDLACTLEQPQGKTIPEAAV